MTLFDGLPLESGNKPMIVLSASRMTDMPKYYPQNIIAEVEKRLAKGLAVHSLVLWTKHPQSLLSAPLYDYLLFLKSKNIQLAVQLTITGLGQLPLGVRADQKLFILEPNAPPYQQALATLPQIVALVEKPDRIRLRVDPLVTVTDSQGNKFSNLSMLPDIIEQAAQQGIGNISFSFLERLYDKVLRRFRSLGCTIVPPDQAERIRLGTWFKELEQQFHVQISPCCVPGFPDSKCINNSQLQQLHNLQAQLKDSPPRRRPQCGCSQSIDLGGWPPKPCFTGCDYCYARPVYVD